MDETVMLKFKVLILFFFLLFFTFLKMVLSSVFNFISDFCMYKPLASYSSEEYCEVLSQQAIPLTLYVSLFFAFWRLIERTMPPKN